ncbi:ISL3 family transposase [Aerococcaceae bacterium zg-B36]|uniref:ISL3 family transposase n=1 Tax=Aerococcaceae bacterium zg-252 TaxID=2796928 RepID=UPI001BD8CBE7|nr:ISL3 family transposase [Aerococcaceae bacterium zg-B36]
MTYVSSIHQLLSIEDKNITFDENLILPTLQLNKTTYKLLSGKLSYTPSCCDKCGAQNSNQTIIKYGFKTIRLLLGEVNFSPLLLQLKKQRFLCKACGETFIATTTLADKHCHISQIVKRKIMTLLTEEMAMSTIAKQTFVSSHTVIRVLRRTANTLISSRRLSETLCIDEFKSVKNCQGKMSFIFCDGDTHEILDIVENRKQQYLIEYFLRFERCERLKVKFVVMDMFKPYIHVIQTCFPNANIIIDKFHVVQHLNRSLNRLRVEIMKQYRYRRPTDYRKLKQLWKLVLKNRENLDVERFDTHRLFDGKMTEKMIVDYLVNLSPQLSAAYQIINDLKYDIATNDSQQFKEDLITSKLQPLRQYVRTSLNTLIYHLDGIHLSLEQPYTNGPIEGLNNRIKNIKRCGYGYRNFYNLRARILLVNRLFKNKETDRNESSSLSVNQVA